MRYSFIAIDHTPIARELRDVIQTGTERASERLAVAEKVAAARRASAHTMKVVTRTLRTPDLVWERMVHAVQGFRK